MKTLVKIATICIALIGASPSFAQVRWGVDLHFGTPPPRPREIVVERPYPDAIWEPGYYNHIGYRYMWLPGRWRHPSYWVPPGHRYGWHEDRDWHRNWDRDGERGRDHDRGHEEFRRGRIR